MSSETEQAQREHLAKLLDPAEVEAVMCVRAVRERRLHEVRTFFDGRDVVFDVIDRRRPMRGADAQAR